MQPEVVIFAVGNRSRGDDAIGPLLLERLASWLGAEAQAGGFALIEDYFGMEWVEFIDQMTRLCKGVAFYCASGDLASCVMESYLSGKKKKTYIA